jgi:hypothetical protein
MTDLYYCQVDRLHFCMAWLLDQAGPAALNEVWFVVANSEGCAYGVRDLVHGVVIRRFCMSFRVFFKRIFFASCPHLPDDLRKTWRCPRSQSFNQPASHAVSQPVIQPTCYLASQSVNSHSASQSISHSASLPVRHSATQIVSQSFSHQGSQSASQPANQLVTQAAR